MPHRLALAALLLFAACVDAPERDEDFVQGTDDHLVEGTVTYEPEQPLPPDAALHAELLDVTDDTLVLADTTRPTAGRQVPLPFVLRADTLPPDRTYAVRARLLGEGGEPLWTTPEPVRYDPDGPQAPDLILQQAEAFEEGVQRQRFVCHERAYAFSATLGQDEAALRLPTGRDLVLPRVPSEAGARYEGDGVLLWQRGENVTLETADARYEGCRARGGDPFVEARQAGVRFRGVGQEPGWFLHVGPDSLVLLDDYATRRRAVPLPAWERQGEAVVYDAGPLHVEITDEVCRDAMSGQPYSHTVVVEVEGQPPLHGCGRPLFPGWPAS